MKLNSQKDFSYGVILFDEKGRLLIIKSRKHKWGLPKGHKEKNNDKDETGKAAAARELFEETGVRALLTQKRFSETYQFNIGKKVFDKRVTYWVGFRDSNLKVKVDNEEVIDYKWVTLDEAENIFTFKELKNLTNRIKKWKGDKSGQILA